MQAPGQFDRHAMCSASMPVRWRFGQELSLPNAAAVQQGSCEEGFKGGSGISKMTHGHFATKREGILRCPETSSSVSAPPHHREWREELTQAR